MKSISAPERAARRSSLTRQLPNRFERLIAHSTQLIQLPVLAPLESPNQALSKTCFADAPERAARRSSLSRQLPNRFERLIAHSTQLIELPIPASPQSPNQALSQPCSADAPERAARSSSFTRQLPNRFERPIAQSTQLIALPVLASPEPPIQA